MTKQIVKIYLETEDLKRLKDKAEALGFIGRANLTRYIEKIARSEIAFLDSNVRAFVKALNLK